jgi:peptidoglycan/xylan/chitin deacetylase (PgdA/CDA1 family)
MNRIMLYRVKRQLRTLWNRYLKNNALVFLYHRVADVKDDPHQLSVSPENFYQQIDFFKKNFNVISLEQLVEKIKRKKVARKDAVITFDDGYADNIINALPALNDLNVPATIFVTAGKIDSKEPFYWDNKTKVSDQGRALTLTELRQLASNPLIEIGSHTLTHPRLVELSTEEQRQEIINSKVLLESILKRGIKSFSYPFGTSSDYTDQTIEIVKKAGYRYACANNQGGVNGNSDIFTLSRRLIRNWPFDDFKRQIRDF